MEDARAIGAGSLAQAGERPMHRVIGLVGAVQFDAMRRHLG